MIYATKEEMDVMEGRLSQVERLVAHPDGLTVLQRVGVLEERADILAGDAFQSGKIIAESRRDSEERVNSLEEKVRGQARVLERVDRETINRGGRITKLEKIMVEPGDIINYKALAASRLDMIEYYAGLAGMDSEDSAKVQDLQKKLKEMTEIADARLADYHYWAEEANKARQESGRLFKENEELREDCQCWMTKEAIAMREHKRAVEGNAELQAVIDEKCQIITELKYQVKHLRKKGGQE